MTTYFDFLPVFISVTFLRMAFATMRHNAYYRLIFHLGNIYYPFMLNEREFSPRPKQTSLSCDRHLTARTPRENTKNVLRRRFYIDSQQLISSNNQAN